MARLSRRLWGGTSLKTAAKEAREMRAGTLFLFPGIWEIRDDRSVSMPFFTMLAPFTAWNTG